MRNLIATKAFRYGTRRLAAEDLFQARPRDARLLVAIGKARESTSVTDRGAEIAEPVDPIAALRERYEEVVGKRPFNGWDAKTLADKIAAHQAD